jgi:acrylyl-CoA reductase (NADPH)
VSIDRTAGVKPREDVEMPIRALVLDQQDRGVEHRVVEFPVDVLPEGDVRVAVEWSSLNYKDALILAGRGRLVRTYPHVPGIDLAGTVLESANPDFAPGDRVILTGWRVGETWWGGYAEEARVRSEWLVSCPPGLTLRDAMVFGTAGLTAALACLALDDAGITPHSGSILVTGATGGLGSIAVHLLSRLGYSVTAATSKPELERVLRGLGATHVIPRQEIEEAPIKPLLVERWAGVIDAVGGTTLSHAAAEVSYGGMVALCGNASGNEFAGNVLPFLLRGIGFTGVDSVMASLDSRRRAWGMLAEFADLQAVAAVVHEVGLEDVPGRARAMLEGSSSGRTIVRPREGPS